MLGHAKASMTLDVYADLFEDDLDSVAESLDAAIRSTADRLRTRSGQLRLSTARSAAQNESTFSMLTNMPCLVRWLVNRVPSLLAAIVQPTAS